MRWSWIAVLAWSIVLSMLTLAGSQEAWKQVTSVEGRFTCEMPVEPTSVVEPVRTPVGTIDSHVFRASAKPAEYEVVYQDLPNLAFWFRSGKAMLNDARLEYLKELKATQVSDTPLEIEGNKARQVAFTLENGEEGQALFLLVGHRMYVVQQLRAQAVDSQRFFSSFRILPKDAKQPVPSAGH